MKSYNDTMKNFGWLSKKDFDKILKLMPIPCIDLLIESGNEFLFIKRKLNPYKGKWATPGTRIFKGESIRETIERTARNEVGIKIPRDVKEELTTVVSPKFKTWNNRQDISICFHIKLKKRPVVKLDKNHSSFVWSKRLPNNSAMSYREFLKAFKRRGS